MKFSFRTMSYGMGSSDYFSKHDGGFGSGSGQAGAMRYGAESSLSQFRDRGDMFSSNFGHGMGGEEGFGDRRLPAMGVPDYDGGYNNMQGVTEYNGRLPQSPLMRGMKHNMSHGSGFGGRPEGPMGISGDLSTKKGLLSLGLQAQQFLDTQPVGYGPPAPKMRRLNQMMRGRGLMQRGMTRGRGMMQRGMTRGGGMMRRGGAAKGRGGSKKVKKKPRACKTTHFHCYFCHTATKTRKAHAEHVRTKEHTAAMKERGRKLIERMHFLHKQSRANAAQARMIGLRVYFCSICTLQFTGNLQQHKKSDEHLEMVFLGFVKCDYCDIAISNRIQYERHNVTQSHIRNHMYKLMEDDELRESDEELECPEEYDESETVGSQYVTHRRGFYCKVCDKLFSSKDVKVNDHCKSKEHFDNFKVFVVTRKAELEEKAAERARKAEEAARAKEASDEKEDEDPEGVKEEDEQAENEEEGKDTEEVDEEQALAEENENGDVEME